MKKILLSVLALLISVSFAQAQSIGVSYAYSSTAPNSGYSAHFETSLFSLGVASLNTRLRATMFSEKDFAGFESADVLIVDLNIFAKVSVIPMINPYAGIGIAYETTDFKFTVPLTTTTISDSQKEFPLYGTIGVEFSPIPFIKPFLEYRVRALDLKEIKNATYDSDRGIVALGLAVSF